MQKLNDKIHFFGPTLVQIIQKYGALGQKGEMAEFLARAKNCKECEKKITSYKKRPLNRLVNDLDLRDPEKEAERIVKRYEHFNDFFGREPLGRITKKGLTDLEEEVFYDSVMKKKECWPNDMSLSIGVCGWTDAGLFLHKSQFPPKIMIVASDWYPLLAQDTFLIEREDSKLLGSGFAKLLFSERASEEWSELLEKAGVYFTNAMLCYRPGKDKTGSTNLSMRSFNNCRGFLEAQIKIVKPDLLISWGVQATSSIFKILAKYAPDSMTANKLECYSANPFKEIKTSSDEFPLQFKIGDNSLHFHPLYHPSSRRCHWGEKTGKIFQDYSKLKDWIDNNKNKWSNAWL